MIVQKNIVSILTMFILAACQPQAPSLVLSATATDRPTAIPATVTPTSTPEATPILLEEQPGPFQFESIKMFDENGTGEIEKTSGWAVAILPDGYEYVLHTEDGGKTWTHPTPTMGLVYTYSPPIFLSSQIAWNTNLDGKLERTLDGGKTWNSVWDFANRFGDGDVSGLYFWDADRGLAEWAAIGAGNALIGLNETDDGGVTWSPLILNPPWEGSLENGLLHLCNLCADRIYLDASKIMIVYGLTADQSLGSTIELAFSLDEGKTWKNAQVAVPEELIHRRAQFGQVTFFDDQQGVFSFWATNKQSFEFYEENSMLFSFYTKDGGLNWTLRTPTPTADISQQFVGFENFLSPNDAVLRCGATLCVTHDGAQSWTLIQPDIEFPASPEDTALIVGLDFIDPSLGFAVLSSSSYVTNLYQTSDGGRHWTRIEYQLTE